MADIFVSYAREDRGRVQPLVAMLVKQGWSVFWDRELRAGQDWKGEIARALEEARCVLVVWTVHSVKSVVVNEEAGDGMRRSLLVPVRLDDVEPQVGHGFRGLQFADLRGHALDRPSEPLRRLLRDIGVLLRGSTAQRGGTSTGRARESVKLGARGRRRPPRKSASRQRVSVGEVRLPKGHPNWDGRGPREIRVPVAFDAPFASPPKVIVSLREMDLGDAKASIHRISVRAENVSRDGFDLCFATWLESQVYGAVASWMAVSD